MPVNRKLNKEIRVLQRESLGAGISFLRLGRRGHAPQRNVATPRQNAATAATIRRHWRLICINGCVAV